MIKKLNAVCSWILTAFLIAHLATMSYSMWTGWYDFNLCKAMAHGTAFIAVIHIAVSLIILFFMNDGTDLRRYKKNNMRVILQRASGLVIIALLHLHVQAFGFIVSGEALSVSDKAFILVTEIAFFAAIFVHLCVSLSRSFITVGLVRSDSAEKKADIAAKIICVVLMIISSAALLKFVITWTGFGG